MREKEGRERDGETIREKKRQTLRLVTYPSGGHPAAASTRATNDVAAAAAVRASDTGDERARDCCWEEEKRLKK